MNKTKLFYFLSRKIGKYILKEEKQVLLPNI